MVNRVHSSGQSALLFAAILLMASLACNAVTAGTRETLPPPPQRTGTAAAPTATSDATLTPEASPTSSDRTPLPTFTPIVTTRDPNATTGPEPTATGTVTATATMTATATSSGPLTLSYTIIWTIDPNDPATAIAHVTLSGRGGNGDYTYYHDDIRQPGPSFTFRWSTCRNKPGSFRIDSSDGQSVRTDYFERAPCPEGG